MEIKKKQYAVVSIADINSYSSLYDDKQTAIKEAKAYADDNNEEYYVVEVLGVARIHSKAYYEDI